MALKIKLKRFTAAAGSPTTSDLETGEVGVNPIQKKIFTFFPLFITIILAPFAAGLILYWTCTNILRILQQWIILKKTTVKNK